MTDNVVDEAEDKDEGAGMIVAVLTARVMMNILGRVIILLLF